MRDPSAPAPHRRGFGWYFRWLLIFLSAGSLALFTVLFTALPGFGYRSPRYGQGDFREAGPEGSAARPEEAPVSPLLPQPAREEARQPLSISLYYPQGQRPSLLRAREVLIEGSDDLRDLLTQVLDRLQHPPEGEGLLPGVPAGTRLLTHFRQEGALILNLSPEFQDASEGGLVGSFATLYAVVNSLTSLPGVDSVRFLISNQEVLTFRGSHALDKPFHFFPGAVDPEPPPSPAALPPEEPLTP